MKRIVSIWLPNWSIERRASPDMVPASSSEAVGRTNASSSEAVGQIKASSSEAVGQIKASSSEAVGQIDNHAFALVADTARGLIITAVNKGARAEGLRPGMALADARAMLPALATAPARAEQDHAALTRLARWCGRYGPARHVDGDNDIWIDVTGVAALFAGRGRHGPRGPEKNLSDERALLADLTGRLRAFGLTARVGLADTLGAAHALARFARLRGENFCIAAPGETRDAIAGLPVEALRLETPTVQLLKRLGLRRIGQLYGTPRPALERRFHDGGRRSTKRAAAASGQRVSSASGQRVSDTTGQRVSSASGQRVSDTTGQRVSDTTQTVLLRLDQALGLIAEPRAPMIEPRQHIARQVFAEPLISADALLHTVGRLAADLGAMLESAHKGARRLRLSLYRSDGSTMAVIIGTSFACRDPRHFMRLLQEKIDGLDAGFGIDALSLNALHVEPLQDAQTDFDAAVARTDAGALNGNAAALIDRLTNRLGAMHVFALGKRASHLPERAQIRLPASEAAMAIRPLEHKEHGPAAPPFLLPEPEPILVMAEAPEGPPLRFTWRRMTRRIVKAQGPRRIEPEWWRAPGQALGGVRDYYQVEDEKGGRYWLFRQGLCGRERKGGPPCWFVHGLYG